MTDHRSPARPAEESTASSKRFRLFRLEWTYLRGWMVIVVLVILTKLVANLFSGADEWLEPFLASSLSTTTKLVLALAFVLIVPWALGRLTLIPSRLLRRNRGVQMFRRMERRLAREFRPDESRGYQIALVDFPTREVRTLGVVGTTLREPETGRELVTVFLPGTPDPIKGSLRVVSRDDLTLIDWTLQDLITYHVTLGASSAA